MQCSQLEEGSEGGGEGSGEGERKKERGRERKGKGDREREEGGTSWGVREVREKGREKIDWSIGPSNAKHEGQENDQY